MTNPKLVIVEDDQILSEMLQEYFESQSFDVVRVADGVTACEQILAIQPDIVLLDLMLPEVDGLTICRQVRRSQFNGKILILTASDDDFDHVAALETGADDFVSKPVQQRVLLARVRTLLRRNHELSPNDNELHFGKLSLNKTTKSCVYAGQDITMAESEFELLWLLASSPEQVLSRSFLTQQIRGVEYDGFDRFIDNKIVILRKKLNDISMPPKKIITVRGKGYLFVPERW
ncbi:Transcriptional regulatory protein RstA [Vibrio harveyi]|jgi:two-component system response regulator RstA|nr:MULTISPECIES: response regulator transcription factor [Vibrio]APP07930.1 DNA-binding response regulator [Vibrio harveyi]EKO3782137.1 response regulator transcription factor [Vibrio harveyi]EKO3822470.1 response regulator transcription factor [Vibrio harveyi]EKO3829702.1 response regulator transcription factor [Vibrio harveyi]EKY4193548.1 response regulator transcription factor [Vibrio harveyi]